MTSKHLSESHPESGDGTRPTKRRRVEMPSPAGFFSNTSTNKPIHKSTVPRFHSSFGDDATERNLHKPKHNVVPRKTFADQFSAPHAAKSKQPNDVANEKSKRPKETKKLSSMMDISMKVSLNSTTTKPQYTSLRPAPPPPPLVGAVASSLAVAPSGLKQIVPPAFPVIKPSSNSKPLQPLQCTVVPVPHPVVPNKKELRALSTTGLAVLNDLSSDNFAEGLASIFLCDQHPELLLNQSESDGIVSRGLEMSPDKKGKNKNVKFVRGGLAAYASSHFDRMSTAHILWRKGIEHALPASEFCAFVIKILHKPTYTSRPSSCSPGIALCQIRQQNGTPPHAAYKSDYLYQVVFATLNGSTSHFPTKFAEGQTILIFKPYQELSTLPAKLGSETPEGPRQPFRLPIPVPTPESTPNPLDAPIHHIALVCTRFHIQQ